MSKINYLIEQTNTDANAVFTQLKREVTQEYERRGRNIPRTISYMVRLFALVVSATKGESNKEMKEMQSFVNAAQKELVLFRKELEALKSENKVFVKSIERQSQSIEKLLKK